MSIYVVPETKEIQMTRGDAVSIKVSPLNNYKFQKGDVIRMNVTKRKNSNALLLTKDFYIDEECDYFFLTFDKEETKIGDIINEDTDYWYEIVLNPDTNPQTIIGYEMYKETGDPWEKILKLLPEANDDNEGSDNL